MTREEVAQVTALLRACYPNEDIRVQRTFGGLRIEVSARGAFSFRGRRNHAQRRAGRA